MSKQLVPKWVGIDRRDESSLLQNYLKTKDLSYLLALYRPYMHLVYGVAFKFVQEPKQSQQIVYRIFKKLINDLPKQDVRIFGSWLHAYTRDYCERWRANNRPSLEEIIALGGTSRTPITFYEEDDQSFQEEINRMEKEIKNLKNEQEKCLHLFFKEQKCFQEIADITGWDVALIKRHIRNAKRRINIYQE